MLLSRFSSLRFLAATSASKLNATAPASNLLPLHTSATRKSDNPERSVFAEPSNRRGNPYAKPRGPFAADAPRVAVVVSGCGDIDGSSILETTSLAIHLHRCGLAATLFAPQNYETRRRYDFRSRRIVHYELVPTFVDQWHSYKATRNAQFMSARLLLKHRVRELQSLHSQDFDALVIPGGAGVGLVLSDFLDAANAGDIDDQLRCIIKDFAYEKKPIGTISYAGLLVAKVISKVKITVGRKVTEEGLPADLIDLVTELDAEHVETEAYETCADDAHRVYSAPGLTVRSDPAESIFDGIGKLVDSISQKINERDEADPEAALSRAARRPPPQPGAWSSAAF